MAIATLTGIAFTAGYAWQASAEATRMELALSVTQTVLAREQRLAALGGLAWQVNRSLEVSLLGRNLLKDRHTEFINIFPVTRAYDAQRSALVQAVVRF